MIPTKSLPKPLIKDIYYIWYYIILKIYLLFKTYWNNNITFWCLIFHTFRYVTDATVAVFIAMLLFILPSKPPRLCFWSSTSSETGRERILHNKMSTLKTLEPISAICWTAESIDNGCYDSLQSVNQSIFIHSQSLSYLQHPCSPGK